MIRQIITLSLAGLFIQSAYAFNMNGSIPANITLSSKSSGMMHASSHPKTVYLLKVTMTDKEKAAFLKSGSQVINMKSPSNDGLPTKADVGMNNVPVLNQGHHGSCVTFAITGALDALLGKGDYISQLCNLELGQTIKQNSYLTSGWNGSDGRTVLEQIMGYGIVSKKNQLEHGCAGKKEYPLTDFSDEGSAMSPEEFHKLSENIGEEMDELHIFWEPMLQAYTRMFNDYDHQYKPDMIVREIKKALVNKDVYRDTRLTFGVLLPLNGCQVGACGKRQVESDTWVITDTMKYSLSHVEILGGHEMIITGYDDDAIAYDNEGGMHKGLFTLRNSWGKEAGDQGNYYMSYDFFKYFVIEINKIQNMIDHSDE